MSYETLKANFQRACELLEDKDHQVRQTPPKFPKF